MSQRLVISKDNPMRNFNKFENTYKMDNFLGKYNLTAWTQ